jgi:protein SCO1/2
MQTLSNSLPVGALLFAGAIMAGTMPLHAYGDDNPGIHSIHHEMMMPGMMMEGTKLTTAEYAIPDVKLVREDGKTVSLSDELNDGHPVVMNFVFTTCQAICPVTSKVFSQLQDKLGSNPDKVHLVSISIDPEHDTPPVLRTYAKKYGAGKDWQFYTGTVAASIATQKAFDVYRGDKMNHIPVTLLRTAHGKHWVRIEGFASADQLLHEFNELVAEK